jgi:hypothetical protein
MSETTPDKNERNTFTKPGFILSAALIAALFAAAVMIAFLPRNDEPSTAAPSSSPSSFASASAGEGTEESVCELPGNDESALGTAPESDWELTGTMAVPSEPDQFGPGALTDSGTPYCFSHNPTGALYAAANIFASVVYGDQLRVFRQQVAESELREEAITALEKTGAAPDSDDPKFQIQGFLLDRYTGSNATVILGLEVNNGAVGSVTIPLVWEDGDWKLVLEQGGPLEPRQLNDLSEFIPWSGL